MGVALDKKDAILAALREGQRPDGGWGKADGSSDLESTYRVMRAFFMLKEKPDLETLRGFLARCRQSDGGYAVKPSDVADVGGTYYATTVLRWTRLLEGEPALIETAGFVPLCNGKDLDGWEGDSSLWSVRDGMLVGTSPGIKRNNFLATGKCYGNFILQLGFRLVGGNGNSGVQFRSVRISGHEMAGYQADIGQDYWGCLYDESRRNLVLEQASPRASETLNKTGWNRYEVRAMGDRIRLSLNGDTSVEYREKAPAIARDGRIAFQIHAGGPMEIQFKDIQIQPLPSPTPGDDTRPGFHLRTVKTDQGERKYTVYVPVGYDGKKPFPIALFLHGSGERGDDGTLGSMVGLGAAIYGHPEDYPMIAVFPQARRILAGRIRRRQGRPDGARRRPLDLQDGSRPRDPDGPVDGGQRELVTGRRAPRAVRRRRADPRAGEDRNGLDPEGSASLELRRRRRPRRDGPRHPCHD